MAPLKTNALKEIIWRLMTHGAIHRANINLHKKRFADSAEEFDRLLSAQDDSGIGRIMRSITSTVGKMQTPSDAAVLATFQIAGLDHKNPMHWWVLLVAFCEHHFAEPKSKPVEWDEDEMMKIMEYVKVVEAKHPDLKDNRTAFAKEVQKLDEDLKKRTTPHVARRIREARDPQKNLALRYPEIADPQLRKIRADYERIGVEWTPDIAKKNIDMLEVVRNASDDVKEQLGIKSK